MALSLKQSFILVVFVFVAFIIVYMSLIYFNKKIAMSNTGIFGSVLVSLVLGVAGVALVETRFKEPYVDDEQGVVTLDKAILIKSTKKSKEDPNAPAWSMLLNTDGFGQVDNFYSDQNIGTFLDIKITSKEMENYPYYIFFKIIRSGNLGNIKLNAPQEGGAYYNTGTGSVEFQGVGTFDVVWVSNK